MAGDQKILNPMHTTFKTIKPVGAGQYKKENGMNIKQRIIVILGGLGILHSSMVPPVSQLDAATCRYHEFVERSLFFTQNYGINHGDTTALISEYGIIAAIAGIAYLIAGACNKKQLD